LLLSILAFYLLGSSIFYLLKIKIGNLHTDTFGKLVTGIIVFVFAVSIYFTKGKTVNLGFLILFFGFLLEYNKNRKKIDSTGSYQRRNFRDYAGIITELVVVSLLLFGFKFYLIYSNSNIPVLPHGDYIVYSNLSDFLKETGKENITNDYIFTKDNGVSPYHYFELWLNAGLTSLFKTNSLLSLLLLTYTVGAIIAWLGFCALISFFRNINIYYKALGFLFLFITGAFLEIYTKVRFMENIAVFSVNLLDYYKLFPLYIFLLSALLFFLNDEYNYGILILIGMPIISISTSFGIFPACFLLVVYHYIKKEKSLVLSGIILILSALFIFLFYTLMSRSTVTIVPTDPSAIGNTFLKFYSLRTSINVVGATSIQIALLYLPALVILFLLIMGQKDFLKNWKRYSFAWLPLLILAFSLISWTFIYVIAGTVQVFSNIGAVILNILSATIFILAFISKNKKIVTIGVGVFLVLIIINVNYTLKIFNFKHKYSVDFLNKIYRLSPNLSVRGAFMLDSMAYKANNFSYLAPSMVVGGYLAYASNPTFPLSISPHNYPYSKDAWLQSVQRDAITSTPFYKYVEIQKAKDEFKNLDQSRLDFIREYKINYLITTKDIVLDSLIKNEVKEEFSDAYTGEKFLLLK
jgi:hypothetical protein